MSPRNDLSISSGVSPSYDIVPFTEANDDVLQDRTLRSEVHPAPGLTIQCKHIKDSAN